MANFLDQEEQTLLKTTRTREKQFLLIILILLVLGAGGAAYWYFDRDGKAGGVSLNDLPPQPQLSPEEIQDVLQTVDRHIVLPPGEPLIATVQDAASLKKLQPFFDSSENGDQLLVYPDRAFLYRPSADKLINVGPVYRGDDQSQGANINLELRK